MVSYKPLFKLLVDRNMSKADLRRLADISPNTMTKLRRGEEVSMTILNKICVALGVTYGDIVEYVHLETDGELGSNKKIERFLVISTSLFSILTQL